jgi:LysR family transcriptional repressor of citA
MNIEYLKTFITLAENGSFSKTAKEHIVVQSTVSSRIQELEREVGQRLFTRNKNYAELTLAGKALLEYAEGIVDLGSKAIDRVNLVGAFTERLVIGTVYAFHKCYMAHNITSFLKRHSEVSVRIEFGHSKHIISAIHEGKIDIGYSHHAFNHVGFRCELLTEDDIIFVSGGRNKQFAKGIALSEIRNLPVYNSNFLYSATHNKIFPKYKIFQLDVDIGENIIPCLRDSGWYTFFPKKLVQREVDDGSIIEIPILDDDVPPIKNFVIYRQDSCKTDTIRKWLQEFSLLD